MDLAAATPAPLMRPNLTGTRHMVAAGHYLAAQAGFIVLEAGGNAVDAGVAAGIALGVVQSELVNFAGVAPIMIYLAGERKVETISGLGCWPRALPPDLFQSAHGGAIPESILRVVVPAAPDAWITALEQYGTMTFSEVAAAGFRLADEGFVMYPQMANLIADNAEKYARWPGNAAVYLPDGKPPVAGTRFRQPDLAATLRYMSDQEYAAAGQGRATGLQAARDAFYRGDIGATIIDYHKQNGGLLRAEDLADFRVGIEPPVEVGFAASTVYTCGPWCQGPALAQALSLLKGTDLAALGHNTPDYIHLLVEAQKLAFADRHAYYGDPRFVDVPVAALLSDDYAAARRGLIDPIQAAPGMPRPGDPRHGKATAKVNGQGPTPRDEPALALDTSYVAVVDRHGNAFSATPSDVAHDAPVVPGTGICPSSRGSQSWADPAHPSSAAPGKRPRLTPNPALAIHDDGSVMPFGTPGGDVQCQAMLQVLLNATVFGMTPQAAVEAPRFATASFPSSFEPHNYYPGRVDLEARIPAATGDALAARGHDVNWWPDWHAKSGAVCLIHHDPATGIHSAGADQRRTCYAVGW